MTQKDHDPKKCSLCAMYRHPARRTETRELKQHLAQFPIPRQTK